MCLQALWLKQKRGHDMKFDALDWAIVIAFLIGNLVLGYVLGRKVTTAKEFNLGSGSTPWWAIGLSVIATYISALSFWARPPGPIRMDWRL